MATTTTQNFADHLEIQQVINLYASAIDKHQWSALESVFTEDAGSHNPPSKPFGGLATYVFGDASVRFGAWHA